MKFFLQGWLSRAAERLGVGILSILPDGECLVVFRHSNGGCYYRWLDTRQPFGRRIKQAGGTVTGYQVVDLVCQLVEEKAPWESWE